MRSGGNARMPQMKMDKVFKLLIINPGSTSTKISLFANDRELYERSQFHDAPVLLQYPHVNAQVLFRYQVILDMLKQSICPRNCRA